MCNDIEFFVNLIYMTNVMNNLHDKNFDEYLRCIEITQDWERFNNVQEIIDINNFYINSAISEVLLNEKLVSKIKQDTQIDIGQIKI